MRDSNSATCSVCGAPRSGLLNDNCPTCLMRLVGAVSNTESRKADEDARPSEGAASPAVNPVVRSLRDYDILEEVARGGMGVVYRARQISLNRTVAVKVLLAAHFANDSFVKRFRREAEAAAKLNHPNIVSVYEVGQHEEAPFFSMELIEGRSLAELAREGPLPARRAAALVKTIAEAVQFAHERGVLHRDLKPSNVLIDAFDAPHITDFGLAKVTQSQNAEADLTLTGQVLGSPSYMPPEQADPKRGRTTAASDVYSLGAILYQLLTGRPPFMAETLTQTLRLVADADPVGPRLLNPSVAKDLETICGKCLEKDPQRRYASAQELADELGRFLRDEPIRARPIGRTGRLARWCRRKPALAASLGTAAMLLLILAIGSPIAIFRIDQARDRAEAARTQEAASRLRAEALEHQTEQRLYAALLEQARANVRSGEVGQRVRALAAVRQAAEITNTIDLQREALAALALPDLRFDRQLPTGPDCTIASLDPQFKRLAVSCTSADVEIRSVPEQTVLARLPARTFNLAEVARWSADGRFLGLSRERPVQPSIRDLEVWDVTATISEGQVTRAPLVFILPTPWDAFSFHPAEPRILCQAAENWIVLYSAETGQELRRYSVIGFAHHLEFSPDGRSFIAQHRTGGTDYREGNQWHTSLYDANTGAVLSSAITGWIDGLAWHPEGRLIALALRTGEVHLHDRKTGETHLLGRHKREARTAVFSPDGGFLFTGGEEQEIICWDLRSMQRAFTVSLQSQLIHFRADGKQCAVITKAGLLLHDFEPSTLYRELRGDLGGGVNRGVVSSDGRWLAAGGTDRLGLWDLTRDGPATMATNLFNPPTPLFSPDGSELIFFWREGIVRWSIAPGASADAPPQVTPLPIYHVGPVVSVGFFGKALMLGTGGSAVLVPPHLIATGPGEMFEIGTARGRISPDGVWVAFRKWSPHRELIYQLSPWRDIGAVEFDSLILAETFTPRSDELAVATYTAVTFLDTKRWEQQRRFPVPLDRNAQIIFTPDGNAFWLVHDARTAALYDTCSFETLARLPPGTIPLAVSPDGRHLVVSVDARRVQVWDFSEARSQLRALGLDFARSMPQ